MCAPNKMRANGECDWMRPPMNKVRKEWPQLTMFRAKIVRNGQNLKLTCIALSSGWEDVKKLLRIWEPSLNEIAKKESLQWGFWTLRQKESLNWFYLSAKLDRGGGQILKFHNVTLCNPFLGWEGVKKLLKSLNFQTEGRISRLIRGLTKFWNFDESFLRLEVVLNGVKHLKGE